MFSFKLFFTTLSALSAFYLAGAMPTGLTPCADWKTELGWDGKVVTPFELGPKNAVNAITGKRAVVGGVYFCSEANYGGKCAYVTGFKSGDCVGVGRDFNDNVSSFGPDDRLSCTIFSDAGCRGRATGGVTKPGIFNLKDFSNNDAMSSFRCTQ